MLKGCNVGKLKGEIRLEIKKLKNYYQADAIISLVYEMSLSFDFNPVSVVRDQQMLKEHDRFSILDFSG
jgi:hypothetical protein